MALKSKVSGRIAKPLHEVFEAVADPQKLSKYFATGAATQGRLVEGATVTWDFHDFPGAFPVQVLKVVPDKTIVLHWPSNDDAADGKAFTAHDNTVTFEFEALEDGRTLVTISEEGWAETPKGNKQALGNTEGWTGCLAAMKVWLEHGINLREGFYK
ncbi:MAG: SRPBCC family protein [Devosia sp.]